MIYKNGKKVIGVYRGNTPITKAYKGNNIVLQSKEKEVDLSIPYMDVVLINNNSLEKIIVKAKDVKNNMLEQYKEGWTPIGIVVIPFSHNVYGNGLGAMISLKTMSASTPDEGTIDKTFIYYGQNNVNLLPYFNKVNVCLNDKTQAVKSTSSSGSLPVDAVEYTACAAIPGFYYRQSTTYVPSPYKADGSRNPTYYLTTTPSSEANCLADFDGVGNTNAFWSKATALSNWKTAATLTLMGSSGYSAAACACWRYHTLGTKLGDWYMPAMGELGYLITRYTAVNNTIGILNDIWPSCAAEIMLAISSSTQYDINKALLCSVETNNGLVTTQTKNANNMIRAFLRIDPPSDVNNYDYVDMGEAGIWASYNVGASKPSDFGDYFAWGEVEPKEEYTADNYKFGSNNYTKYNSTDNKQFLELEDDTAHVHMGGSWRMPTATEIGTLYNLTNQTWTTQDGVEGMLFTLKTDSSKQLFFPAAGYIDTTLNFENIFGNYWTSSLNGTSGAIFMNTADTNVGIRNFGRFYGQSVRGFIPKF